MRKTERHTVYTKEEKIDIVKKYLNGDMSYKYITRYYDLSSSSTLYYWKKKYLENGTISDNRGKSSSGKGNRIKRKELKPETMSREELINYVKAVEDIKKLMVFLKKQKKNIK